MAEKQIGDNSNNIPGELQRYRPREPLTAKRLNQAVDAINKSNRGFGGSLNQTDPKGSPQLYIATEDIGPWYDSASSDNGVVIVRPIRMIQYQEDAINDDVEGDVITLPKFWNQSIFIGDIGIGVNMGNGVTGFYALTTQSQVEFVEWVTIDTEEKLSCLTIEGNLVYVEPATGVNEDSWDGQTIDGIEYTKIDETSRTADPGGGGATWTENLFPFYGTDEKICVVKNDYNILDVDNDIPFRESGTNKIWVKDCS